MTDRMGHLRLRRAALALLLSASCGTQAAVDAGDRGPRSLADARDEGPTTEADVEPAASGDDAVRELFRTRCSTASCHGGGSDVGASLILTGLNVPGSAAEAFVNRRSEEVAEMMLVVPGRPADSYLMRKLDGTFTELSTCRATPNRCGVSMPWRPDTTTATLSAAEREIVQRWITDGAPGRRNP